MDTCNLSRSSHEDPEKLNGTRWIFNRVKTLQQRNVQEQCFASMFYQTFKEESILIFLKLLTNFKGKEFSQITPMRRVSIYFQNPNKTHKKKTDKSTSQTKDSFFNTWL